MTLDEVKERRPECISEDGKHVWVEYSGSHYRECIDCKYEEPIVKELYWKGR